MVRKVLKWAALAVVALGCAKIGILYGLRGFALYGALVSAAVIYLELARRDAREEVIETIARIAAEEEAEEAEE